MSPARRVLAALLGTLAALATLVAPAEVGAQERRVVVVGDSIILGAEGPMVADFRNRGWGITFDAAVSRSTSAALAAVESHRAELTDSLVLSIGANDAGNTAAFRQRVAAILDATAGVPHVYVLTIREVRDYYGPANQAIRDVAAGRPNVTVVDWHAATAGDTSLTAGDGLHLNGAGAARMTQLVADAVVAGVVAPAVPPPPPPTEPPPPTTVAPPPTAAPSTVAPSTTQAATTTAAPTTTDATTTTGSGADRELDEVAASAESTLLDADSFWTVGGAFALVIVALAIGGALLGGWALIGARDRPSGVQRSPAHPAVRARLRADRIATAVAASESDEDGEAHAQQS